MKTRVKGDGGVYLRGTTWWAHHSLDGKLVRTSLGVTVDQTDQAGALRMLRKLTRKHHDGSLVEPNQQRVTVNDLLDLLLLDLEVRGKDHQGVGYIVKSVRERFGHRRAVEITTTDLQQAQLAWLEEGKSPKTVNERLNYLLQAYRHGMRRTPQLVKAVPQIKMLEVHNARQGFLSLPEAEALIANLTDEDVRDFIEWFWLTGMRPIEIRRLGWQGFDRETWTLTIAAADTKTKKARTIAVVGRLRQVIERRLAKRIVGNNLIFHRRGRGGYKNDGGKAGYPVQTIYAQWRAALEAAGLRPSLRPYDLRRSAVRNLIRAGVSVAVTMDIAGHTTMAMHKRYNITEAADTARAFEALDAYHSDLRKEAKA